MAGAVIRSITKLIPYRKYKLADTVTPFFLLMFSAMGLTTLDIHEFTNHITSTTTLVSCDFYP
jgi:hypothetical protein